MNNLLKPMFPSFSSLRVDELDDKVLIGTPRNPGQMPWFPNTIDEKSDEEDEDYKPDDEMEDEMEEEPLEYVESDDEKSAASDACIVRTLHSWVVSLRNL